LFAKRMCIVSEAPLIHQNYGENASEYD